MERECTIAGCGFAFFSRGLCRRHYHNWIRGGSLTKLLGPFRRIAVENKWQKCSKKNCESEANALGLCKRHYDRQRYRKRLEAARLKADALLIKHGHRF